MVESGNTSGLSDITSSSIQLLDDIHYLRELVKVRPKLDLSPVNIAVICDDIAHKLTPVAATNNIELLVKGTGSKLVLSHRLTLLRAYENIVRAMLCIDASKQPASLTLSTSTLNQQVRFGAYHSTVNVVSKDLSNMRNLFGASRRPLSEHATSPVTELFIADKLLSAMGLKMRTAISSRQHGFASLLSPSSQLALLT